MCVIPLFWCFFANLEMDKLDLPGWFSSQALGALHLKVVSFKGRKRKTKWTCLLTTRINCVGCTPTCHHFEYIEYTGWWLSIRFCMQDAHICGLLFFLGNQPQGLWMSIVVTLGRNLRKNSIAPKCVSGSNAQEKWWPLHHQNLSQ